MAQTVTRDRVLNAELGSHVGQQVRVEGWIHAIRKFGAVNFLILRDRTGVAQAILEPDQVEMLAGLQVESVVAVEGTVQEEERAANGVEIRNARVQVISPVTEVLP